MNRARWILLFVLLVSAGLRIELASRGGQSYWPDELRYHGVRDAVAHLAKGDGAGFIERMLGTSDHILFRFVALVPAVIERGLFSTDAPPPVLAAVYFGGFGVGAIFLVWLIVRRITSDESAATWATLFYAGSSSAFLYSRHIFPYDAGLFFLLFGWWCGLRTDRAHRLLAAGVLVGVGYLVYNAYWNVGALILVFLTLQSPWSTGRLMRRGSLLGLGLLSPVVFVYAVAGAFGFNLIAHAREFSQTVVQGDFGEAWRFIPAYFAASERAYPLLLLSLIATGVVLAWRRRERLPGGLWLAMGAALAAELLVLSDVIPRFAVAGRMARPLMLFLAAAAGAAAARLLVGRARGWSIALGALTVLLAAPGFRAALAVVFPEEFRKRSDAIAAVEIRRQPDVSLQRYYTGFMHWPEYLPTLPPHEELLRAAHPHQFRPYLFEGYPKSARARFMTHDFAMRLVRLLEPDDWRDTADGSGAAWAPHPGAVELRMKLPEPRPVGRIEPLVVSGVTGRGDLLSLRYVDDTQLQLIADHWGWGAWESANFVVPPEPGRIYRIVVASPALVPPSDHPFMQQHPELQPLAERLVVEWEGECVASAPFRGFAVTADAVYLGENVIGGSTAEAKFSGEITTARRRDLREVAHGGWGLPTLPPQRSGEWAGKPGPQGATVEWANAPGEVSEDVTVFTMRRGFDEVAVTARPRGDQIEFSLWTSYSLWQPRRIVARAVREAKSMGPHRFWISSPWLTPNPEEVAPIETLRAAWLQARTLIVMNGEVLFNQRLADRGIEMAETIHGQPLDPAVFAWGGDWPLRHRTSTKGGISVLETGSMSVDQCVPVVGVVAERVTAGWSPGAFPIPLRLRVRLPAGGALPPEPLLVTGRPGAADGVFVIYESAEQIRVGHDHWGAPLVISEPLRILREAEHTLTISLTEDQPSRNGVRRGELRMDWNGEPVLRAPNRVWYEPAPGDVAIGHNVVGMGTSVEAFSGDIVEVGRPESSEHTIGAGLDSPAE